MTVHFLNSLKLQQLNSVGFAKIKLSYSAHEQAHNLKHSP